MTRWLAALLLPLLAGCWTGDAFYAAVDARAAIAPGDYATTSMTPEDTGRVRVSRRGDGLTLFTPIRPDGSSIDGDAVAVGFAPLGAGRLHVGWLSEADSRVFANAARPYGLLAPDGGGGYRLLVPACDATEAAARAAGAAIARDDATLICHFADRAALEAALRGLAVGDEEAIRLTPWGRR